MTVTGEHLTSDVIALCGGKNIFVKAAALTPTVSAESVLTSWSSVSISPRLGRPPENQELFGPYL